MVFTGKIKFFNARGMEKGMKGIGQNISYITEVIILLLLIY